MDSKKRESPNKSNKSNQSMMHMLKMFDIYSKVDEDFRVQTTGGGWISIIGWIVIGVLVTMELQSFFAVEYKEHMIVDTSLRQKLSINVDITFHSLTCADVHLDAMDVAGDNQLNMEQEMFKQRLSPYGYPVGEKGHEIIGHVASSNTIIPVDKSGCESCFGAESSTIKCCNSCKDLVTAYRAKGWSETEVMKTSAQCLRDSTNPFASVSPGEGCRVSGTISVNKVAGNIHMSLGTSVVRDGAHVHQFAPQEAPGFNVSHTIHSFSFGKLYPGMPSNPLDHAVEMIDEDIGTGLFQYFIKVIPTIYTGLDSKRIFTNQYTYTAKFRPIGPPKSIHPEPIDKPAVIPGIFFVYEISPFLIEVKRIRVPLFHLFTRLCAIVGGVFSIFGVIDALIFRIQKLVFVGKK